MAPCLRAEVACVGSHTLTRAVRGTFPHRNMYVVCTHRTSLQSLERLGRLEEGNVSEAFSQLSSR